MPGVIRPAGIYSFLRSHESHIKVNVSVKKQATLSSNENRYIIWGALPDTLYSSETSSFSFAAKLVKSAEADVDDVDDVDVVDCYF